VARYIGPTGKLSRREGVNLFLKGRRDTSGKAAIERRNYPPGMHGKGARVKTKVQGYGLQLREKQKVKRIYGLLEKQFRLTFERASKEKGVVGETLLSMLERRLDNTVYRLGFASTRAAARQLVNHGHVKVNDKKVNIASYQVSVGDQVALAARASKNVFVAESLEDVKSRGIPKWLELDADGAKGKVLSLPARDDVNFPIQEQLIVELYSK
jgi:small subunit ribosomal protein S4